MPGRSGPVGGIAHIDELYKPKVGPLLVHSRSAVTGETRAARRAGITQAATATTATTIAAPASIRHDAGVTSASTNAATAPRIQ